MIVKQIRTLIRIRVLQTIYINTSFRFGFILLKPKQEHKSITEFGSVQYFDMKKMIQF